MSTADVIRQMLVDLNLVTDNGDWRAYTGFLPGDPDLAVCVYDTAGTKDGRLLRTGEQIIHPGIMIMVRGRDYLPTRQKAHDIALALDAQRKTVVAVESTGSYIVHNVSRTGDIMSLGMESEGDRRRHMFTINAVVTIEATD